MEDGYFDDLYSFFLSRGFMEEPFNLCPKAYAYSGISDNGGMKDRKCFICEGKKDLDRLNNNLIYGNKGRTTRVCLCYVHSLELFKIGQKSFMIKHKNVFSATLVDDLEIDPGF